MDKIWAPWRKEYISTHKEKECIFCIKSKQKKDKQNYIIKRNKFCFSILNIYPYSNGHIMIASYRHIPKIELLSEAEFVDIFEMLKVMKAKLDKILKPEGYNIGLNEGKSGGAGFAEHIHIHIVPRWCGDTNFMPVVSNTKVIPEALGSLHEKLTQGH